MSGAPVPPAKLSVRERLRQRLRPGSRASSPTPAPVSTQALASPALSPGSSSTQILAPSSPPPVGLVIANSPGASAAPSSQQQATHYPSSGSNLLDDALKRLSDSDRATLREYVLPTSDIDFTLRQALAAAEEKQRYCIEKRWTFTFRGRKVTLKEEADKVVHWLNRFTGVGDVVANVDPVHVGLPWAGIRLLLVVRAGPLKTTDIVLIMIGYRLGGEPNGFAVSRVRDCPIHGKSTHGIYGLLTISACDGDTNQLRGWINETICAYPPVSGSSHPIIPVSNMETRIKSVLGR